MQVIIESRLPVYGPVPKVPDDQASLETSEGEAVPPPEAPYLHLFVVATVIDGDNVRSGPHYLPLPAEATDDEVKAHIAGLFGA